MMYVWEDDVERANRVSRDKDAEIARLRDTVEHYKADAAHDEALIKQLKAALEEITKCDDDGYGPAGYCANIAQKALSDERLSGK
jgi:hypothetical protein